MKYVLSTEYKRILALICKIQKPTLVLHIPDPVTGDKKETNIFYKLRINGEQISLQGYAMQTIQPENGNLALIVPEVAFYTNGDFWVGAPSKVFKDFAPNVDKRNGDLSWAAAFDREVNYAEFYVDLNNPIIELIVPIVIIEKFSAEVTADNLANKFATKGLTSTTDDVNIDKPINGAMPFFAKQDGVPSVN
jgi:hypothetical protein